MLVFGHISDTIGIACLEEEFAVGIAEHEVKMLTERIVTFPVVLLQLFKAKSRIKFGLFKFRIVAGRKQDAVAVIYISRLQNI